LRFPDHYIKPNVLVQTVWDPPFTYHSSAYHFVGSFI